MYLSKKTIKNKLYHFPIFLPDATFATVRNLSPIALKLIGQEGLMVNTFHLSDPLILKSIKSANGIKNFMNFNGLVSSDSGGFQLFSLIKNKNLGKVTDEGIVVKRQNKTVVFTPEMSIQIQFELNTDIMIVLDDFTPRDADFETAKKTVYRTIEWAKRAKKEYLRQLEKRKIKQQDRPLLIAPIQGDKHKDLRKYCAHELMKIGFDGYGLGGWPINKDGSFDYEFCEYNASLTPDDKLRFALGIGKPKDIVKLFKFGYHIFDCVYPTRSARHNSLFVLKKSLDEVDILNDSSWYETIKPASFLNIDKNEKIDVYCNCPTCQNIKLSYLRHLLKIKDPSGFALATIHNLYFYKQLMHKLRTYIN